MNDRSKKPLEGFTVLEILIVSALIAVLLLLALAAVGRVRRHSLQVADANHLRQIWVASEQFALEHRNFLLIGSDGKNFYGYNQGAQKAEWFKLLRPYLGYALNSNTTVPLFISPADPLKGGIVPKPGSSARNFRSYSVNYKTQDAHYRPLHKLAVRAPSQFLYMCNHDAYSRSNTAWVNPAQSANLDLIPRDWFGGKANFLFLDGHVEAIVAGEVYPGGSRAEIFTGGQTDLWN